MTTKPTAARKEQQKQQSAQRKVERSLAVSDEQKSLIRDMRKLGFAPRKGNVTQKHFERYAAFIETQTMAARASVLQQEVAVFERRGGLMTQLLDKMESPGIKATAYANLATTALRLVALAPTLADRVRADAGAGSSALPEDDRLDGFLKKIGGGI